MHKQHSTATVNLVPLYFSYITTVEYVALDSYYFVVSEINISSYVANVILGTS